MGTMVFYLIFLPLFYYYYIFYVCGCLCTIVNNHRGLNAQSHIFDTSDTVIRKR